MTSQIHILDDSNVLLTNDDLNDFEFEEKYFANKTWDTFQYNAFQIIKSNKGNLLITAPTSSGKTIPAKYAILYNLTVKHKRVVYTTPIKSLSNEKYEEMKLLLADIGCVPGLLTGDKCIDIDSQFVIMTAEILANALFRPTCEKNDVHKLSNNFVDSIGCVIMDEIHYISDKERGNVWEKTLLLLDKSVNIIGLSATIDAPEELAQWISSIKHTDVYLIKKYDRPIPLEYGIFNGHNFLHTFS